MKIVLFSLQQMIFKKWMPVILFYYFILSVFSLSGHTEYADSFKLCIHLFGGTPCSSTYAGLENMLSYIIIIMPLFLLVGSYMYHLFTCYLYLILIRSKSYTKWWIYTFVSVIMISIIYSVISYVIVFLTGIVFGDPIIDIYNIELLFFTFFFYTLGNLFLAGMMLSLSICFQSLKIPIVLLLLLTIGSIEIGWFFPEINPFLIGTFSMVKRSVLMDTKNGFTLSTSIMTLLLILLVSFILGRKRLASFIRKV